MTDNIKLPPLPPLHIVPSVEPVDYPEVAQALMDYARAAVEADRAARVVLSDEHIEDLCMELFTTAQGSSPVIEKLARIDAIVRRCLSEQQQGETGAIALLSRMRFACGDNGTRMQDELEQYLRDLKRDAERYRWLRTRWGRIADEYDGDSDQLVAIREADSHFEGWDVEPASLDRAIDAAMREDSHG